LDTTDIILITLSFFVFNCSDKSDRQVNYETINISEKQVSEILLSSMVKDFEIYPIVNDNKSLPYLPVKILKSQQLYIILDRMGSKNVTYFNSNTYTLKVIGGEGEGPGEYTTPEDIFLDKLNRQLIVLATNQRKLIYYSLENFELVKERRLPFSAFRFYKDKGHYYFLGPSTGKRVIVTDDDLNITNKFVENDVRHHFKAIDSFYKIGDNVIYHSPFSPLLYTFKNGRIINGRKIMFNSENFTDEIYKSLPKFQGDYEEFSSLADNYRTNFGIIQETANVLYFICNYDQETSIGLYNKNTEESIVVPYTSFKNDLTFERAVKVIGRDEEGYFLNLSIATEDQKNKILKAFSKSEKPLKEAKAFLIRYKIDPNTINKFSITNKFK